MKWPKYLKLFIPVKKIIHDLTRCVKASYNKRYMSQCFRAAELAKELKVSSKRLANLIKSLRDSEVKKRRDENGVVYYLNPAALEQLKRLAEGQKAQDRLKKKDIERLLKDIEVRQKDLFNELLATAGANLDKIEELEKAVDLAHRKELTLAQIRASADKVLKEHHGVPLKSGLRLTAEDLKG